MLKAKRRSIKARNDYEQKTKLIKNALSRGFGMNIIRMCLDAADDFDVEDNDETDF